MAEYTIYLSEPLRKIGDYADKVEQDGTVTRRIKKLVLDGTENCQDYPYDNTNGVRFPNILDTIYSRQLGLCTILPVETRSSTKHCVWIGSGGNGNNTIYFVSVLDDMGLSTPDDFKAYLAAQYAAGTPVTVWYVLATAQTETVTAPTITPAKGANTLTVDTDLQPSEVSITGKIKQA